MCWMQSQQADEPEVEPGQVGRSMNAYTFSKAEDKIARKWWI